MIGGSWCSKSRLVQAAGAEGAAEKRYEKWHAAVARSTFLRQNLPNTSGAEPFWKLRSGKMARRCGAKHISKSKCTKHLMLGAILEVVIRKNGAPLWREAHFQVKMNKTPQSRSHFWSCDLEKWHAAVARSTFVSQNAKKLAVRATFWRSAVEKWHAVVARTSFGSQNVQNTCVWQHFQPFLPD